MKGQMSIEHHGLTPQEQNAKQRLYDEIFGRAKLKWPHGQISNDDLGETAFAIAVDPEHNIVRIHFTKPMMWLGLDRKTAEAMRDLLDSKIKELR